MPGIERLVSPLIRSSLFDAQGQESGAAESAQLLTQVQALFDEPSNGLSSLLGSFWNAWQQVANSPSDPGARDALVSATTQLTTQFNSVADRHDRHPAVADPVAAQQIGQVNSLAQQVASLNGQITTGTTAGQDVNALEDQRDQLISPAGSARRGRTVAAQHDPSRPWSSTGSRWSSGNQAYALQAATTPTSVTVTWAANGQPANLTAASSAPRSRPATEPDSLDARAVERGRLLADPGRQHAERGRDTRWTRRPVTGVPFFQGTGAGDIAINPAISANTNEIAASTSGAPNDGSNAQAIANLATAAGAGGLTIDQQYNTLVVQVGTSLVRRRTRTRPPPTTRSPRFKQLDQSVSGVSTSDEQTALLLDESQSEAASSVLQAVAGDAERP